jgi:hypothetical protein
MCRQLTTTREEINMETMSEFWEKFTGRAFTEIDDLTDALTNLEFKVSEYYWELEDWDGEPCPWSEEQQQEQREFIAAREADMAEIVRRLMAAHVAIMADDR